MIIFLTISMETWSTELRMGEKGHMTEMQNKEVEDVKDEDTGDDEGNQIRT